MGTKCVIYLFISMGDIYLNINFLEKRSKTIIFLSLILRVSNSLLILVDINF